MKQLRFFLRSKQFKKTLLIVVLVLTAAITAGLIGGYMAPHAGIVGSIIAPFQRLGTAVSEAWTNMTDNFKAAAKLNAEKEQLEKEVTALREQLVDFETAMTENEFYKDYLEIKELNPDFKFCPAKIISTDPSDVFGGFTVGVGSAHGVSLYDPVITDEGLVGFISQVGTTTSKVTTVLSPELTCGAYDSRTNDSGALSGNTEFAAQGNTRFFNLPRTCSVAVGDIIVTSGNGIFPDKVIIGTVSDIGNDPISSSLYATVTPAVDFEELRSVMVITEFAGQGNSLID